MAAKRFESALIITGDGAGGARAIKMTREQLEQLSKVGKATQQDINQLNSRVSRVTQSMGNFAGKSGIATAALSALKAGALAAGAAIVGSGLSVGSATKSVLALSKELKIASQQLGVTTQDMQVWSLAGSKIGVDMEKMRDIFKDTSDKLGDFVATGGGEAKDIVEKLGLNVARLNAMRPDQVLLEIGDALNRVKGISQHEKIFLLEALANDASVLLPLLEANGKMLNEVRKKAEIRGQIISPADMEMLRQANEKISESKAAMAGLKHQVGLLGAEFMLLSGTGFTDFIDSISARLNAFDLSIFVAQVKHGFVVFEETAKQSAMYVSTEFQVLLIQLMDKFPVQFAKLSGYWDSFSSTAGTAFDAVSGFAQRSYDVVTALWSGEIAVGDAFWRMRDNYATCFSEIGDLAESGWNRVKGTFVYEALTSAVSRGLSDIKTLWGNAVLAWENITQKFSTSDLEVDQRSGWKGVESIVRAATTAISAVIERGWSIWTGLVQVGLKVLQGDFSGAWGIIETGTANFVARLQESFSSIGGNLLPDDLQTMGADLLKGLGVVTADVVPALGKAFKDIMNLTQELRETIWHHWDDITNVTSTVWNNISNVVRLGWDLVVDILTVGLRLLRGDFSGAWDAIKGGVERFSDNFTTLLSGLLDPVKDLPAKTLALGKDIVSGLSDGISGLAGDLWSGVKSATTEFSGWWSDRTFTEKVLDVATFPLDTAKGLAQEFFTLWSGTKLGQKTASVTSKTLEWVDRKAREFVKWWQGLSLKSLVPKIKMPDIPGVEAGRNIVSGLATGMKAGADVAVDAVKNTSAKIWNGITSFWDMHSPSRRTHDAGLNIDAGLAGGLNEGTAEIVAAAGGVMASLNTALDSSAVGASALDNIGNSADGAAVKVAMLRGDEMVSSPLTGITVPELDFTIQLNRRKDHG